MELARSLPRARGILIADGWKMTNNVAGDCINILSLDGGIQGDCLPSYTVRTYIPFLLLDLNRKLKFDQIGEST